MKKLTILLVLILTAQFTSAQDFKFGKVSKQELEEKVHPIDADAAAAVLYRKHNVVFEYDTNKGFVKKIFVHERIKIYNEDGYDYATIEIRLYKGDSDLKETVHGLKAVTYNLEGKKITEDKLKKDQIFEEDKNEYWKLEKFTMPNVNNGSVIEYKYEITSPSYGIDDIPFQQTIPINKLEVKVATPEYLIYKTTLNPKSVYWPKLNNTTENEKIVFNNKTRTDNVTTFSQSTREYKNNVVTSNCTNIPALKDERFVDNLSNYQSKLVFELNTIAFPREQIVNLSTSWDKVAKTIYKYESFGGQLKKSSYYSKDLEALLTGETAPVKKASMIFNYVKSRVKWDGFYGYSCEKGVSKAYKEQSGNIGDINLMLISMLRHSGIEANPVLVSTRANGIPIFPTRSGFNYVVCLAEFSDGYVLLDASNIYTEPNIIPERALNWQGRLIKKDGSSSWISLRPKKPSLENVSMMVSFNDEWSAEGKIRKQFTEHSAYNFRDNKAHLSEEEFIKELEKEDPELEVLDLELKNLKELGKTVVENYEFVYHNAVEEIGDKLYFSPLLFLSSNENPFKQGERLYPIDFIYPKENKYLININIPEGYQVESLPENKMVEFNGKDAIFKYFTRKNQSTLQIIYDVKLNKSLILPEEYPQLKEFFQAIIDAEESKIVLTKI